MPIAEMRTISAQANSPCIAKRKNNQKCGDGLVLPVLLPMSDASQQERPSRHVMDYERRYRGISDFTV